MSTPFTTRSTPLDAALGGTQSVSLPSGTSALLTTLFAVPAKASSALLQVVAVGGGELPVVYRLDGDTGESTGLVLALGDKLPLSNRQQLQGAVLRAAESGVTVTAQFFSSLVQPL